MKYLILILVLVGCGKQSSLPVIDSSLGIPAPSDTPTAIVVPTPSPTAIVVLPSPSILPSAAPSSSPVPSPSPSPTPSPVTINYYSIQRPFVNQQGQLVYSTTGYCTFYNSNTYCWDDGIARSTLYYSSYWNICSGLGCNGGGSDLVIHPTLTSAYTQFTSAMVANVFSRGTLYTVDCTLEVNSDVVCFGFTITAQEQGL